MGRFLLVIFFFAISCVLQVHCWKTFHLGHINGGLSPPDGPDVSENVIQDKYFTQYLQHYNIMERQEFVTQRYFVNDEFFDYATGNKVFLIIGGAEEASKKWMKHGVWAEAAKKHKALLFMLEHRFYGKSIPFDDLTPRNIRFFNTHLALDDLAVFIDGMNTQYNLSSNVKWYAFGGSYAGTLAAFLRSQNPHLVAGAVAISAPLQAVIDYSGYLAVVIDNLAMHSQTCVDNLQEAFKQLDDLINDQNSSIIDSLFNTCEPFKDSLSNSKDISNFYHILSERFGIVSQFQNIQGIINITTNSICDILVDMSVGNEIERLAKVNSLMLQQTQEECLDYKYEKMVSEYQDISYTEKSNMRQWLHQTCNDFAWYPTSNQSVQIFGDKYPASFFIDLCEDVFNYTKPVIDVGVFSINNRYGGQHLERSKILFVHGSMDPWYPLGVTDTADESLPAIIINGSGHCAAMYSESENDSEELKKARNQMLSILDSWIKEDSKQPTEICSEIISKTLKVLSIVLIITTIILLSVVTAMFIKLISKNKSSRDQISICSESTVASSLPEKVQVA